MDPGVWHDTLDRLTEAALPFTPADTASQVARAAHRFGLRVAAPPQALALLLDHAVSVPRPVRDLIRPGAWPLRLAKPCLPKLFRLRRLLADPDPPVAAQDQRQHEAGSALAANTAPPHHSTNPARHGVRLLTHRWLWCFCSAITSGAIAACRREPCEVSCRSDVDPASAHY